MMRMTSRVRRLIESNATSSEIRAAAGQEGMRSIWDDGVEKARDGMIPVGELLKLRATFEEQQVESSAEHRLAA